MKYIGGIITAYIVLLVLDIIQSRNHKRTQSIKKFTIRTITDVSMLGAIGSGLWVGILIFALIKEPELFKNTFFIVLSVIWLGLMFFAMIAPVKGVWDICVDGDNIAVIKAFLFKRHWKISDISYCKNETWWYECVCQWKKEKSIFC